MMMLLEFDVIKKGDLDALTAALDAGADPSASDANGNTYGTNCTWLTCLAEQTFKCCAALHFAAPRLLWIDGTNGVRAIAPRHRYIRSRALREDFLGKLQIPANQLVIEYSLTFFLRSTKAPTMNQPIGININFMNAPSAFDAIKYGDLAALTAALDAGMDPEKRDGDGWTLLMDAIRRNRLHIRDRRAVQGLVSCCIFCGGAKCYENIRRTKCCTFSRTKVAL